jgi:hypothetical protein
MGQYGRRCCFESGPCMLVASRMRGTWHSPDEAPTEAGVGLDTPLAEMSCNCY